jgi:hypothetical protein
VSHRFVLRYTGEAEMPDDDVRRIGLLTGHRIIDKSPRMLLVDVDEGPLRELVESMPDWVLAPEQGYSVPDTRKRIRPPTQ